jgi:hypothetical protein
MRETRRYRTGHWQSARLFCQRSTIAIYVKTASPTPFRTLRRSTLRRARRLGLTFPSTASVKAQSTPLESTDSHLEPTFTARRVIAEGRRFVDRAVWTVGHVNPCMGGSVTGTD